MDVVDVYSASASLKPDVYYKEKAKYTEEARSNRVGGVVVLTAIFNADGRITNIRVVRSLPFGLTEEAILALSKFKFRPAIKDGVPVSVRLSLEFAFDLLDGPVNTSVKRPKIVHLEPPVYTEEARVNNIKGKVILNAQFNMDGTITNIRVMQGLPFGLTEEAIKAAQKIKFEPGRQFNQPITMTDKIEFKFPPKK